MYCGDAERTVYSARDPPGLATCKEDKYLTLYPIYLIQGSNYLQIYVPNLHKSSICQHTQLLRNVSDFI